MSHASSAGKTKKVQKIVGVRGRPEKETKNTDFLVA